METTKKPKVIILQKKAIVDGFKYEFYPKLTKYYEAGKLDMITSKDALGRNDIVDSNYDEEKGEVLILNPYVQKYWSVEKDDLQDGFISSKALAIERAFDLMGAHCVILKERIKEKEDENTHAIIDGKYNGTKSVGVNVEVDKDNKLSLDLSTEIEFCNLNNTAASINDIEKHLNETGLDLDQQFQYLLEDLRAGRKEKMKKKRHVRIEFTRELKSALKVAADLNALKILEIGVDVNTTSSKVHTIEKELWVYFDEVPQDVQDLFNAGHV